jgi:hypothetical protein
MPTSGTKSTTIFGITFALSNIGRFGKTSCDASTWVSVTSIQCFVALGGFGHNGPVVATSGSTVGSFSQAISYDSPISALVPSNIKTFGDIVMVMGADLGVVDTTTQCRLSSSAAQLSLWLSDTTVMCKLPSGVGSTLPVLVTVAILVDDLTQAVSYDGPTIVWVLNGGHNWSVTGTNFGTTLFSQSIRIGLTQSSASYWESDSSISSRSASGHPLIHAIVVTAGQSVGSFASPNDVRISLSTTVQCNNSSSNDSLRLLGKCFGLASYSGSVRYGLSASQLTEWVSESSIFCKISGKFGSHTMSVCVTICTEKSTHSESFKYDMHELFHSQTTVLSKQERDATGWISDTSMMSKLHQIPHHVS